MEKRQVTLIHFSPTGGTRKAGMLLARGLGRVTEEMDLTSRTGERYVCPPEHLVVLAGPVYGGRMPETMMERLSRLTGNGAWAIPAAVYGNRAWEDGLAELADGATARGFRILAGAALVAQHSIVPALGAGRPDAADEAELASFGKAILDKLAQGGGLAEVPGDRPYRGWKGMAVVPAAEPSACTRCGLCVDRCPVGAIPAEKPYTTGESCIRCMRCVSLCPVHARSLPAAVLAGTAAHLEPFRTVRGANHLFL